MADCTCQNNCSACGPQGTGCSCAKGKCDCPECPNKAHTAKCACKGPNADACGSRRIEKKVCISVEKIREGSSSRLNGERSIDTTGTTGSVCELLLWAAAMESRRTGAQRQVKTRWRYARSISKTAYTTYLCWNILENSDEKRRRREAPAPSGTRQTLAGIEKEGFRRRGVHIDPRKRDQGFLDKPASRRR